MDWPFFSYSRIPLTGLGLANLDLNLWQARLKKGS